jgi:hypothetical protein
MALQLVLSLGHIHFEKLASGSAIASVVASKAPSSQQNPAHHPANDADDFCAICATIHLASSSFLPDAPLWPAPFASRTIEHFSYFNFTFVLPQRAAFQSRAPPLGRFPVVADLTPSPRVRAGNGAQTKAAIRPFSICRNSATSNSAGR